MFSDVNKSMLKAAHKSLADGLLSLATVEVPGADINASTSIDRSLVWNFHMSWTATDVSDWLLQLALACFINTAADDQLFICYFQHSLVDYYGT